MLHWTSVILVYSLSAAVHLLSQMHQVEYTHQYQPEVHKGPIKGLGASTEADLSTSVFSVLVSQIRCMRRNVKRHENAFGAFHCDTFQVNGLGLAFIYTFPVYLTSRSALQRLSHSSTFIQWKRRALRLGVELRHSCPNA